MFYSLMNVKTIPLKRTKSEAHLFCLEWNFIPFTGERRSGRRSRILLMLDVCQLLSVRCTSAFIEITLTFDNTYSHNTIQESLTPLSSSFFRYVFYPNASEIAFFCSLTLLIKTKWPSKLRSRLRFSADRLTLDVSLPTPPNLNIQDFSPNVAVPLFVTTVNVFLYTTGAGVAIINVRKVWMIDGEISIKEVALLGIFIQATGINFTCHCTVHRCACFSNI